MNDLIRPRIPGLSRAGMERLRLLVLFVAIFQGWMSFAGIVSSSHDPSNRVMLESATLHLGVHEADHSHDDDSSADDRDEKHHHGHNAADHSHDKPSLTGSAGDRTLSPARNWRAAQDSQAHPSPFFVFERPPKSPPTY